MEISGRNPKRGIEYRTDLSLLPPLEPYPQGPTSVLRVGMAYPGTGPKCPGTEGSGAERMAPVDGAER